MIVVLDDDERRVDRLRGLVGAARVRHARTVRELLALLAAATPGLVVLDHDLGGRPDSRDCHGASGLDAAARMPAVSCPILVWSRNPVGAQLMVGALAWRGMRAQWVRFGDEGCDAAVTQAIGPAEP